MTLPWENKKDKYDIWLIPYTLFLYKKPVYKKLDPTTQKRPKNKKLKGLYSDSEACIFVKFSSIFVNFQPSEIRNF